MAIFIDPPNVLPRITQIWVFVSIADDGSEGICAAPLMGAGSLIPLIAADEARLESLRPIAAKMATLTKKTKKTIKLVKFESREDLEVIEPQSGA